MGLVRGRVSVCFVARSGKPEGVETGIREAQGAAKQAAGRPAPPTAIPEARQFLDANGHLRWPGFLSVLNPDNRYVLSDPWRAFVCDTVADPAGVLGFVIAPLVEAMDNGHEKVDFLYQARMPDRFDMSEWISNRHADDPVDYHQFHYVFSCALDEWVGFVYPLGKDK
jgi:hypothetical protein